MLTMIHNGRSFTMFTLPMYLNVEAMFDQPAIQIKIGDEDLKGENVGFFI